MLDFILSSNQLKKMLEEALSRETEKLQEALSKEIDSLEDKMQKLVRTEIQELKKDMENLKKEISKLSNRVETLESKVNLLEKDIDEIKQQMVTKKEFEEFKNEVSNRIGILESKVNLLEGSFRALVNTSNLRNSEEVLDLTMNMVGEGTGFNNTKRRWSIW